MFAKVLREQVDGILHGKDLDLRDRKVLLSNMARLYHIIRASETLLEVAVMRSNQNWQLKTYYLDHLEEERNHHVWLLEDLKIAGVNPFPCPPSSSAFAGAIYYHIRHTSPVALLGYMLVMEGNPMSLPMVGELEEIHGKDLLRTARYHSEHDVDHARDLFGMIDDLPVQDQMTVKQVALETAHRFAGILDEIRGEK